MIDPANDRRFPQAWNTLLVLVIVGMAAVAAGLVPLSHSLENDQGNLIRGLSSFRVDGQRLFHAPPSPFDTTEYTEVARRAEVFLLTAGDTGAAARVRALLAVGSGRLREAAVILESLANREDPEILNDLGVVYWGIGEQNPSNYFRALTAFERAAQLSPDAAVPRFNAALAYRRVELHDLADAALKEYQRIDRSSFWVEELSSLSTQHLVSIDELRRRLEEEDVAGATSLLERDPGIYRSMAIEYALNPPEAGVSDRTMQFVLNYFAARHGEETVNAVLGPLGTRSEHDVVNGRRLAHLGTAAYFQAKFPESLHFYDLAEAAMRDSGSVFDELWLKLKRADTRLRLARSDAVGRRLDIEAVHRLLDEVIAKSRSLKFDWLLGHALASKGVASMTIRNQDEILPLLREAVDKLTVADDVPDAARPLYYLATIHFLAGDFETSLSMIYRSLRITQPDDHVRQAELYWLAGVQLYRMGFERYGLLLEKQALNEALASQNRGLVSFNASFLAMMNVAVGEYEAAQTYQHQARMARDTLALPTEREAADVSLNLLCGQLSIATGNLKEGEGCLNRLLAVLKPQPKPAPEFFAQALLQLARIHSLRGELDLARQQFREATDIIEQNDEYFSTAALRTPFENQRRNLYEAAISFEYDHGGKDAAWGYTQQYRSKLFLEFLRQMNPGLVLDQAIDRSRVQELIPSDVQVVEYVILKDRLLIWLVSKDKFVSTSVPVSRDDLEKKVTDFVERVNRKGNVIAQSEALYNLLIAPVEPELDPKRALAVIPDQALHRLNFPALSSAAKRTFLIQQYTVLESPNLTTLLSGPSSNTPSRRLAVSFGARTDNTGATRELRALGQFYSEVRSFNGDTAVKPAFLSSLGTASVFHYAGHSQDAADPLRSSILLDGEHEGPNSVTAVDISRRKMPPNSVVVLASCDSSVGNSRDGIGMRGLTSAFLISGAGSVVGSLWLVEAESTSQLVLRFHQNFAGNHLPVAAALRDAQLASIKEGAHPYYWSGFVVTGNTSALR